MALSSCSRWLGSIGMRESEAVLHELIERQYPGLSSPSCPDHRQGDGSEGREHTAVYQVMPDYLAIGSDRDFRSHHR